MRQYSRDAAWVAALLDTPLPPCDDSEFVAAPAANDIPHPNSGLCDAAASYARRGCAVVPVHPDAKNPYMKDWEKNPLRTEDEARAHWQAHPNDNIGWMMGAEYVALDFDFKDGKQGRNTLAWLAQHYPPIRATLTQRSQSGGWHKIFKLTPEQQGKLGKHTNAHLGPHADNSGIDIITGNAIIVVAPSTTPTGTYRWKDSDADALEMPDDLFQLLLSVEQIGRGPASDAAGPATSSVPPKVILPDEIFTLLKNGWSDGCGYPSPSEARAAAYRALHTTGCTPAQIAHAIEKSPLRHHGDTARPPLVGAALLQDIQKVLALPYTGSTRDGAGGGAPNPPTLTPVIPSVTTPAFERDSARRGKIPATVSNVMLALAQLPFLVRYDRFLNRIVLEAKSNGERQPIKESDYNRMQEKLEHRGFNTPDEARLRRCVERTAEENSFDSLTEFMDALPAWDGEPRIDTFFTRYCRTEDTPYHAAAGRYLFTALAGRAMNPGCKADGVIVLIGDQYVGKTSLIHALAPVVGGESTAGKTVLDAKDDDTYRKMQGKTICEIPEMRGFGRRDQEAIKDFISSIEDEWVPKYRELPRRVPRRTIFIATTNEREFLKDPTGNRRWFPIEVGQIEVDAVRRDLPQLLAEAKALYQDEGVLYEEAMHLSAAAHAQHIKHSELCEPIQEALAKIDPRTGKPFGDEPFKLDTLLGFLRDTTVAEADGRFRLEVIAELRLMGYDNPPRRYEGRQERRWVRAKKT